MSKYNHYVREINRRITEAYKAIQIAERALKNAESEKNNNRVASVGLVPLEAKVKSMKAESDFLEAKKNLYDIKNQSESEVKMLFRNLRKSMIEEIEKDYGMNAESINKGVVELLKDDVLTAKEYQELYNNSVRDKNYTMARIIGKYAEKKAFNSIPDEEKSTLRVISRESKRVSGANYIETFDTLETIFDKSMMNTKLIDYWNQFTNDTIEAF